MTKEEEILKRLNDVYRDVVEIKTVLKGYNGNPGLCERHEKLMKDFYTFKRLVIGLACGLVGTGLTTIGISELVKRFLSE